jgi:hypothetical protein
VLVRADGAGGVKALLWEALLAALWIGSVPILVLVLLWLFA